MIKIRYACLPEGQHAKAVARSRHTTTIYLRPGLDGQQRREALARLRRNARLGYAPPLPAFGVARALATDCIAATFRNLLAVLQCHPLGAIGLAGVLAGAAVSYTTLVTCPLPSGTPVPAVSLPAGGDGESAGGKLIGPGLPGSSFLPLGVEPRPWAVPEVRPHHGRHGSHGWAPGGSGGHHGSGWRWRSARGWRGRPGWHRHAGRALHGWHKHGWHKHGWPGWPGWHRHGGRAFRDWRKHGWPGWPGWRKHGWHGRRGGGWWDGGWWGDGAGRPHQPAHHWPDRGGEPGRGGWPGRGGEPGHAGWPGAGADPGHGGWPGRGGEPGHAGWPGAGADPGHGGWPGRGGEPGRGGWPGDGGDLGHAGWPGRGGGAGHGG